MNTEESKIEAQQEQLDIPVVISRLKRYTISDDGRYGHNRDSAYDEETKLWIYEDKNGKWIKYDELINGL